MSFAAVVDNPKTPKSAFLSEGALGAARALSKIDTEAREKRLIDKEFDPNQQYSPMQVAQKLANLNVNPEKKKFIWDALVLNQEMDAKQLAAASTVEKQRLKNEAEELKRKQKGEQALKYGKQLGLLKNEETGEGFTEEELREMEPSDVLSYFRANKEAKPLARDKPLTEEQKANIKRAQATPGFNEMDEVEQFNTLIENDVSLDNAKALTEPRSTQLDRKSKQFENDYKAQEDFINDTTNAYVAYETNTKPRLLAMQDLNNEDELLSASQEAFLNALGIPLGVLNNPGSELYEKLSQDLLKGLPETYGNRILKVEVENFLNTIPRLSNSKEGRRMIASQLLKLGEMKKVFYDEMRRKQKEVFEKREMPKDFQQSIFDNIKPQIDRINQDFVAMTKVKAIPPNTVPFFNPSGGISFVPNNPEMIKKAEQSEGRRIW